MGTQEGVGYKRVTALGGVDLLGQGFERRRAVVDAVHAHLTSIASWSSVVTGRPEVVLPAAQGWGVDGRWLRGGCDRVDGRPAAVDALQGH